MIVVCLLLFIYFGNVVYSPASNSQETEGTENSADIVIGFSQLGTESDWRLANTESMEKTFSSVNGYDLIIDDGRQQQENQIKAIRDFILQDVDYIVLAPVTETGWDTVLSEAKKADIPVIIVDRMVEVEDESLYTAWVGSDFALEGKVACEWLNTFANANQIAPADLHIVNIQGTVGGSAQIGRSQALEDAAAAHGWDLAAEESGEYTQAKAEEVMNSFLTQYDNINVVYCENDNEAYGAIDAIEKAGRHAGSDIKNGDIMVMSFDATREGLIRTRDGEISADIECNPLHGPRVEEIIQAIEAGKSVEKKNFVEEQIFSAIDSVKTLNVDEMEIKVTMLNKDEAIEKRSY